MTRNIQDRERAIERAARLEEIRTAEARLARRQFDLDAERDAAVREHSQRQTAYAALSESIMEQQRVMGEALITVPVNYTDIETGGISVIHPPLPYQLALMGANLQMNTVIQPPLGEPMASVDYASLEERAAASGVPRTLTEVYGSASSIRPLTATELEEMQRNHLEQYQMRININPELVGAAIESMARAAGVNVEPIITAALAIDDRPLAPIEPEVDPRIAQADAIISRVRNPQAAIVLRAYARGEITEPQLRNQSNGQRTEEVIALFNGGPVNHVSWDAPSNEELMARSIERQKKILKKQFDKATFIHTLSPSNELLAILEPLTDKAEILKAVFEYNSRPQVMPLEVTPKKSHLRFIAERNSGLESDYTIRLKGFYDEVMIRHADNDELFDFLNNINEIKREGFWSDDFLKHPLFEVLKLKKHPRTPTTNIMQIVTREDVYFTFQGQRLNFGKFTFNIDLTRGNMSFSVRPENFSHYAAPYIAQQSVCMGDNTGSITSAIRNGRIFQAMTELYTVMTRYNFDSGPFQPLDRFFNSAELGTLLRNNKERAVLEALDAPKVPLVSPEKPKVIAVDAALTTVSRAYFVDENEEPRIIQMSVQNPESDEINF